MNKKYIGLTLLAVIILGYFIYKANHPAETLVETGTGKTDFLIDVKDFSDFGSGAFLEKSGKITSTEEIKLNSQALGRISLLNVKEGDKVRAGQLLLSLQDNVAQYGINLERGKNGLQRAQINYDSTKIGLDKQVFESEIALERIQNSLDALKKNTELDVEQVNDNLKDTDYANLDSQSALQLQKIDNSIAKADLDFQNLIVANGETIEGFKTNLKNSHNALQVFLEDITVFGDKLLGVTDEYKDDITKYESYLGGKDTAQRNETKEDLRKLIAFKDGELKNIDFTSIDSEKMLTIIATISKGYDLSKNYLNDFEKTFLNSIPSIGTLSEGEIAAYNGTINAYQGQLQGNNAGFLTFSNGATSFLRTYKNTQNSTQKQIDLLKQDREITRKSFDNSSNKTQIGLDKTLNASGDSLKSLELQLKSARDSAENAKKTRDVTLQSLQNGINEANISYTAAAKEYAKLTISSPIDGVVGDILVDKGQDVSTGTPLLTIIGSKKSEIEVTFKSDELPLVAVGDSVTFDLNDKPMVGTIYSITKVTDNNFNYKANIIFDTQFDIIGGVVKVKLPIKLDVPLLPMNIVTVIGNNSGFISLYGSGTILQKEVILGKIYGDMIEFKGFKDASQIVKDSRIIMSDVSNFDDTKFTLKITN